MQHVFNTLPLMTRRHFLTVNIIRKTILINPYKDEIYFYTVHPSLRAADLVLWRRSNLEIGTGIASGKSTPALAGGARECALAMTK
jgi:hypothetical protein